MATRTYIRRRSTDAWQKATKTRVRRIKGQLRSDMGGRFQDFKRFGYTVQTKRSTTLPNVSVQGTVKYLKKNNRFAEISPASTRQQSRLRKTKREIKARRDKIYQRLKSAGRNAWVKRAKDLYRYSTNKGKESDPDFWTTKLSKKLAKSAIEGSSQIEKADYGIVMQTAINELDDGFNTNNFYLRFEHVPTTEELFDLDWDKTDYGLPKVIAVVFDTLIGRVNKELVRTPRFAQMFGHMVFQYGAGKSAKIVRRTFQTNIKDEKKHFKLSDLRNWYPGYSSPKVLWKSCFFTVRFNLKPEGGRYVQLPKYLRKSNKAIFEIKNDDDLCGQRCLVVARMIATTAPDKIKRKLQKLKSKTYEKSFTKKANAMCKTINHKTMMTFESFCKYTKLFPKEQVVIWMSIANEWIPHFISEETGEYDNVHNLLFVKPNPTSTVGHYH